MYQIMREKFNSKYEITEKVILFQGLNTLREAMELSFILNQKHKDSFHYVTEQCQYWTPLTVR